MSNSTVVSADPKKAAKERLNKIMQEESRVVKGVFKCYECPGASATFSVRKYPGQGTKTFTFQDGKEYEVPLWVARHLNGIDATAGELRGKVNSCAYPVHQYHIDPKTGMSSVEVGTVRRRYGFQSLDFMEA